MRELARSAPSIFFHYVKTDRNTVAVWYCCIALACGLSVTVLCEKIIFLITGVVEHMSKAGQ